MRLARKGRPQMNGHRLGLPNEWTLLIGKETAQAQNPAYRPTLRFFFSLNVRQRAECNGIYRVHSSCGPLMPPSRPALCPALRSLRGKDVCVSAGESGHTRRAVLAVFAGRARLHKDNSTGLSGRPPRFLSSPRVVRRPFSRRHYCRRGALVGNRHALKRPVQQLSRAPSRRATQLLALPEGAGDRGRRRPRSSGDPAA